MSELGFVFGLCGVCVVEVRFVTFVAAFFFNCVFFCFRDDVFAPCVCFYLFICRLLLF